MATLVPPFRDEIAITYHRFDEPQIHTQQECHHLKMLLLLPLFSSFFLMFLRGASLSRNGHVSKSVGLSEI